MKKRYNPCRPLPTKSNHRNLMSTVYVDLDVRRSGPRIKPSSYDVVVAAETVRDRPEPVVDQAVLAASQWGGTAPIINTSAAWLKSWYYPPDIFDPWPSKVPEGVRCWWCTHSFETPPFPMPYHHDPKIDRYKVKGMFCGPSCAKAYASSAYRCTDRRIVSIMYWIGVIAKKYYGYPRGVRIPLAPPREILREYCGPKGFTIEQFRTACARSRVIAILPFMSVTDKQIVEAEQLNAKSHGAPFHPENPDKIMTTNELVIQPRTSYVGRGVRRLNEFFGAPKTLSRGGKIK
jgi:hypothetical protein